MPLLLPIKLCLLWHQHQPYYRSGDRFVMPWTWLHATKDYLEMARLLERHPTMRATINLVPSLVKQIEEYLTGEAKDPIVELMTKPADKLTPEERTFMRENFFNVNRERSIERSPRYRELYQISRDEPTAMSDRDYCDLAMHYSLAWTGEIARREEPFATLVAKDRDFTEQDKLRLAKAQVENVKQILPLHNALAQRGQIELTTTPFYHPILPLLIDTDVARQSMPDMTSPRERFQAPDEAEIQLREAARFFTAHFGHQPRGLWPSEGSISEDALAIIRKTGFRWTATDEAVLANSLHGAQMEVTGQKIRPEHAKYFPWQFETPAGAIALFFRDHHLSDDIGFNYQYWNADDAVRDFVQKLLQIRTELVETYGEQVLEEACVSVILDGENCWEYYPNNGYVFLDGLYGALSANSLIETVRFDDVVRSAGLKTLPVLQRLVAGSWINANFGIWIGHPEDNLAWDLLAGAKHAIDGARVRLSTLRGTARKELNFAIECAHEELMIAEGSDWCWWYGPEHVSTQKNLFDELFRSHVIAVYRHLGVPPPTDLSIPIPMQVETLDANAAALAAASGEHSSAMSRSAA